MASDFLSLPENSLAAGDRLFWNKWVPDEKPKAVLLLVHGFGEHLGRYEYAANFWTKAGYAVYAIDHWGHGKSDGHPGFVANFSVYNDGVSALFEIIKGEHPGLPVFLLGHSLGGLISARYVQDHQASFAGCILSGPAIKVSEEPSPMLRRLSRFLSRFLPKLGVLALDAQQVSRDPKIVADYLADPLVYKGKISARLGYEMMQNMDYVQQHGQDIYLPMLLLHGSCDGLTDPQGSVFLHENISATDKKLILYPELYHEIFNEPEKDTVLSDVVAWLNNQI